MEELRYEINQLNLDVKLWENFSTLQRQDAFEVHAQGDFDINDLDELIF